MQAVFYRDKEGREPVNDFIDRLPVDQQVEVDATIALLNRLGPSDPPLPFPFSSQIRGQLRELRCHYGRTLFRIIYRRSGNLFILLHIFQKTSSRVPEKEIATAENRWADFKRRMETTLRSGPRPAGKDAP